MGIETRFIEKGQPSLGGPRDEYMAVGMQSVIGRADCSCSRSGNPLDGLS